MAFIAALEERRGFAGLISATFLIDRFTRRFPMLFR
jgi:hypothetical protein